LEVQLGDDYDGFEKEVVVEYISNISMVEE